MKSGGPRGDGPRQSLARCLITHMDMLLQEPAVYSNGTGDNGDYEVAKPFPAVVR